MIMNQDIKPEKQAYFLGAKIIEILKEQRESRIDTFTIFTVLNEEEKVTDHAFAMGMNWLYLLGALKLERGEIHKCF